MIKQHLQPWMIFMLVSLLAHGAFFVSWSGRMGVYEAGLDEFAQAPTLNIELVQPAVRPEPVQVPKEPEPVPLPEPEKLEEIKPVEPPVEQVPDRELTEQKIEDQVLGEQLQQQALLKIRQKEQYMQKLMQHIDAHKFYPAAARRRGIEGEVEISFELRPDKTPANIMASSRIRMLEHAAIQAVEDASPFPEPPADLFIDNPIVISMVYALK